MWKQLLPGLRMTLVLTVLTGVLYPGLVTGLCSALFPHQAGGSLIVNNGHVIGSSLIGQNFTRPEYVQPRPSAAGNDGFDPTASGASNLGPTSQKLSDRVKASVVKFRQDNPDYTGPIPADLVTASASGLDPHLSPASVEAQLPRIAKARGASLEQLRELAARYTEGRDFGLFANPALTCWRSTWSWTTASGTEVSAQRGIGPETPVRIPVPNLASGRSLHVRESALHLASDRSSTFECRPRTCVGSGNPRP